MPNHIICDESSDEQYCCDLLWMHAVLWCHIYHPEGLSRVVLAWEKSSRLSWLLLLLWYHPVTKLPGRSDSLTELRKGGKERGRERNFLISFIIVKHLLVQDSGGTTLLNTLPREKVFSREKRLHSHIYMNMYSILAKAYTSKQWPHTRDTTWGKNEEIHFLREVSNSPSAYYFYW